MGMHSSPEGRGLFSTVGRSIVVGAAAFALVGGTAGTALAGDYGYSDDDKKDDYKKDYKKDYKDDDKKKDKKRDKKRDDVRPAPTPPAGSDCPVAGVPGLDALCDFIPGTGGGMAGGGGMMSTTPSV